MPTPSQPLLASLLPLSTLNVPENDALRALALAIDPETGDSLLHIATAFTGEQLSVQKVIHQTDQKSYGLDRSRGPREHALQTLLVHQNYAGDSALHIAARSGVQKTVTLLYRAFWSVAYSRDSLDITDDTSLPEFEKGKELDVKYREKPLTWLMLRNETGQTAADAARAAGHTDVAAWLDKIVTLLNYDGSFNEQDIPRVIKYEFQ